jgi:hypothetical protein
MARIGRATSPLPRECSTTEPHGRKPSRPTKKLQTAQTLGAGEGNRTLVISLEGFSSTIELHPHTSNSDTHFRPSNAAVNIAKTSNKTYTYIEDTKPTANIWWRRLDSNQRRRKPTDLQSAPFSHSGTSPVNRRLSNAKKSLSNPMGGLRSETDSQKVAT